jgi:muramoyltetrapeptide carboxypeptidase
VTPIQQAPRSLAPGDSVAVVALSSPIPDDRLEVGLGVLRSWGLQVREGAHLRERHADLEHLAGSDHDRAGDFQRAWMDPTVDAIVLGRGGYGIQRMLDLLDWPLLATRADPPLVMGFSDGTALLIALEARLGIAGVHGPVVTSLGDADDTVLAHTWSVLQGRTSALVLGASLTAIRPGDARGDLIGGNLALLASSVGTADLPAALGRIVLLEDVAELPRRVDRMLTHLLRSGWFHGAQAVVCGDFTDCGDPGQVEAVLRDRLAGLDIPVALGARVGHGPANLAFPIGHRAELAGGTLRLI